MAEKIKPVGNFAGIGALGLIMAGTGNDGCHAEARTCTQDEAVRCFRHTQRGDQFIVVDQNIGLGQISSAIISDGRELWKGGRK